MIEDRFWEKYKEKTKKYNIYVIYTMLFSIISFIVFAIFIKYNKSFIWSTDGIKQHFVILYDFNQIVRNIFKEGIPMLSWNMGLGLDVIGQYSYYIIGDFFAYISLLFPMEKLEIAYNFLVILRMYFVGISFIVYCKYRKKEDINIIIGAIIYTFCGFILFAGIRHPYFTNAVILLPLNFIGIEKLLKENKKVFLIFIIFVSAINNYYFFYMITIINIIYALIKYIFEYNEGIKEFFKKVGSAILCYIVGTLMASIILLPTIYAFLNSARTEYEQLRVYTDNFYEFLFMGIISMRFKNWAVIGVSSIVILMLPILITKLKNREVRSYLALFIITTIMLLIPQTASMMNGFSFPSNRWIFAYSFILSYIVTICFDTQLKYNKKQKVYMLISITIYTLIGLFITKLKIKENLDYYASITIGYLIFIVISYGYKFKNIRFVKSTIILLLIANIFVISFALYSPIGKGYVKEFIESGTVEENCSNVNGKIENYEKAIEYIKQNDKSFYRISKKDLSYQNLSLIYDYNPTQLYLSLGNENVYKLSCSLEDNCYSSTKCVNGADRRTKFTTLLSNKYYICDKKDFRYVPYGYTLYHEIENTQIYINENYIPIGVLYNSYITKEQFNNLSPLEKEDALITAVMLEEKNINVKKEDNIEIKLDKLEKLSYSVKDNKIINNTIDIKKKNESIELIIDNIESDTELYLSIKNLKYKSNNNKTDFKITANIDGITNTESVADYISSAYYMKNSDFLMNLGVSKKGQKNKLKLTFNKKGKYIFDSLEILSVSMDKYKEKINNLKINSMQNIEYGNNFIKGTVNTNNNGILQLTTSYSKGWKAFVDDKETKVFKINEAFIGIEVGTGNHNVRFQYKTPYLKLGIICSGIGIIGYIIIIMIEKKKNKIRY